MKWTVFNALGALIWLAGLSFAKGATFTNGDFFPVGEHRFSVGIAFGLAGVLLLLWTNLRNAA